MSKKPYLKLFYIAVCMLPIIILVSGCNITSKAEVTDSIKNTENQEISSENAGFGENDNKEKGKELDVGENGASEFKDLGKDIYWQPCDIMFHSRDMDFAFVYPQDKVSISSNPYIKNSKQPFLLSVGIYPEEKDALPMDYDFAYKPSIKKYEILGTPLTEYLVFSRYDICDVTFERTAVFNNKYHQVILTIFADKKAITDTSSEYFKTDKKNCGNLKIWDFEKQDEFYNMIAGKELEGAAQDWYDIFGQVLSLLQINQYKGASAGYNRLIDNRIFESGQENNYIISASYPQFQPADSGSLENTLNKYIYEGTVMPTINAFMEEISQYGKDGSSEKDFPGWQYMLSIDYEVVSYNNNIISLFLNLNPYTGGAHGISYFQTFNFDIINNKNIGLDDIFKPGFDYISFLSGYCFNAILDQANITGIEPDLEWIKRGTSPTLENFLSFLLTQEGLVIKFPEYQVGPGAAGDFSVLVPYDENMNFKE